MIATKQQQQQQQHQQHQPAGQSSSKSAGTLNATRTGAVKLSNVEAQRIVSLLDETVSKLTALSLAARDALGDGDASILGPEAREALLNQTQLEREYMRRLAESTGNEADDDEGLLDSLAADVYAGAREAARAIARDTNAVNYLERNYGRASATAAEHLRDCSVPGLRDADEADALSALAGVLVRVRDITLKRLLTTAEEERSRWEFVAEVMERERVAAANVRKLQQELATEKKGREKDVSLRHDVIERLKDELSELRMLNAERIKSSERQSKEREASELQHFQTKENALSQQGRQLRQELEASLRANREAEEALRKRKLKLERDVEEWIKKYDTDMEDRHTELEELRDIVAREKRLLAEFDEHFTAQALRREEIESKLAHERLMKEHREKEWLRIFVAASKIQAMFRAFKTRKIFKERMRKRKKKGKKKKKKA